MNRPVPSRAFAWTLYLLVSLIPSTAASDDVSKLPVRLELPRGAWYVGQVNPARLVVRAGKNPPVLEPPVSDDWEVVIGPWTVEPISSTAIGPIVREDNAFVFPVQLVARNAGPQRTPSIRVRDDDRAGTSPPLAIDVRRPPATGRPADFLGGVGPLQVDARLEPPSVRVGQTSRLEIRLRGPGAFGSTVRPSIPGDDRSGFDLRIASADHQWRPVTGERLWTFELRPMAAGEGALRPIRVSTFDPASGRYTSFASSEPRLRVTAPRAFQPDAAQDFSRTEPIASPIPVAAVVLLSGLGFMSLAGSILYLARRRSRSAAAHARRSARRLSTTSDLELVPSCRDALAGYLRRSGRWRGGATVPDEVRDAIAESTGRDDLAADAAELVRFLDRDEFSGLEPRTAELRRAAVRLFRELGRGTRPPVR